MRKAKSLSLIRLNDFLRNQNSVFSIPDEQSSAMSNKSIIDRKNRHNEDYCRRLVNDKVLVTWEEG